MMFTKFFIAVGFAAVISALPIREDNLAVSEGVPAIDTALQFPTTDTGIHDTINGVENLIRPRRVIIIEDGHLTPASIGVVVLASILALGTLASLVIYCVWDCKYRRDPDVIESNKRLGEQASRASKVVASCRFLRSDLPSPPVCHLNDQESHALNNLDPAKPATNLPKI